MTRPALDAETAGRFARLALDCIGREYPNYPLTLLFDDGDVRPPRQHTPAFFGCFDWHSAVHGHWTLVRLLRFFPNETWSNEARSALRQSLLADNLAAEARHLAKPGREGFERPYGLAWLLQLAAELREWDDSDAASFTAAIAPLETLCRDRLADWLPKLTHPIRSGEHSQTAFAMGLALDWAVTANDLTFAELLRERSRTFYGGDIDLPLRFEPSGHDFLSPALAEADLMRRALPRGEFVAWLDQALPGLVDTASGGRQPPGQRDLDTRKDRGADAPRSPLSPVASPDRADGKLAHLDGLNLSRAWMLDGIASALDGEAQVRLSDLADIHAEAGLASVTGEHYAGGHWLGTFATYLLTRRGISP